MQEAERSNRPNQREVNYLGWWPDPLLPNFAFDVESGTTQPVWLSVRVPRVCAAGEYTGTVTISPANAAAFEVKLAITVWDFALPEVWHFRNLLSFTELWTEKIYKDEWTPELEEKFFDFLLDRRINVISMYGNEPYETPERLVELARRGQNVLMAAYFSPAAPIKDDSSIGLIQINRLKDFVPVLEQAGFLDRTIVYGWDERRPDFYDQIRFGVELIQKHFPDLRLMMAGVDKSYGLESSLSGLSNIIYCPLMPYYDAELADRARANGNEVWWYEVPWPIDDYLIRSRLIPWQTFKVRSDGFLIWAVNRWAGNDKTLLATEIRSTTWKPQLDGDWPNSSAMYVYPGVDGPISSLRLENFRDGIEDYDLLMTAQEALKHSVGDAQLVGRLQEATEIPDDFVKGAFQYSTDPRKLQAHRRKLAEALISNQRHNQAKCPLR